MERLLERCCALDVHKASVTACVRVPNRRGERVEFVETYSAMTEGLLALRDRLQGLGVTHVVMEATGVYWKPVWHLLEDDFECLLVNARQVKHVPGRKTDVADAQWLCQLLEHGLLKGSFVPPRPIRELRDLTRYRKCLIRERQREANRLHKLLEDAGIKLSLVASDTLGASGRAMVAALISGEGDPEVLAELAKGRLRAKLPALRQALNGRFGGHHALLASHILSHLDYIDETIGELTEEIGRRLAPFAAKRDLLESVPGFGPRTAQVVLAEIGVDMSVFPSDRHCASWAKVCPGREESAGKRRSGRTGKGNTWLRECLLESARAAVRTDTYLQAQYLRIRARRGDRKAILAVAHSLLVIAYHVLKEDRPYHELGRDYFERRRDPQIVTRRLVRQLEALGNTVTLEPKAA